jgi:hypothetical protein
MPVAGTPERGASSSEREFARYHGYGLEELVEIIENVRFDKDSRHSEGAPHRVANAAGP